MSRDHVLMSDYSNRLSGAVSLRDPSLKHSLLENHLDLYLINFVYFSNALGRLHTEMCFSDCFVCEPSLSKAVLSSTHGEQINDANHKTDATTLTISHIYCLLRK